MKKDNKVNCDITLDRTEYPINTEKLVYTIDYDKGLFSRSNVVDIERKENGKWVSVRKSSVKTNSISGRYAFYFDNSDVV